MSKYNNPVEVDFEKLRDVQWQLTLDLSNKGLTNLPDWFFEKDIASNIVLKNNKLTELPTYWRWSSSQEFISIDLSFNEIDFIPSQFLNINIKVLDLSHNRLKILPNWFFLLCQTNEIDVSFEDTEKLKRERIFGQTDKKKIVYLHGNPIEIPTIPIIKQGNDAAMEYWSKKIEANSFTLEEAAIEAKGHIVDSNTRAKRMLKKIIDREPDNVEAHLWLSSTVFYKERLDFVNKALEINPNHDKAILAWQVLMKQRTNRISGIPWIDEADKILYKKVTSAKSLLDIEKKLSNLEVEINQNEISLTSKSTGLNYSFILFLLAILFYQHEKLMQVFGLVLFVLSLILFLNIIGINKKQRLIDKLKKEKAELMKKAADLRYQISLSE